mgnify:CR=1 FL=1
MTIFSKNNTSQAAAIIEGTITDAGDAVRYRDTGQAGEIREDRRPDVGNAVALSNAGNRSLRGGITLNEVYQMPPNDRQIVDEVIKNIH